MITYKYYKSRIFKSLLYLLLLFQLIQWSSCAKESPYYEKPIEPTPVFNGNVIQYLQAQNGQYDSMLKAIKRYPDIENMLTAGNDSMTLYAIPNKAFQTAIKGFNERRVYLDSPLLFIMPRNESLIDSGAFQYSILKELLSMYIFKGIYNYDRLAVSSVGFNTADIAGYQMNQMAIQENASGAVTSGPKRIQLSDMNYSVLEENWKSVITTSSSTVMAGKVLVHTLSENHQFGFATFNDKLLYPTINRTPWKPMAWHSIMPDPVIGGTVFHAIDNNLTTEWRSITLPKNATTGYAPPPPPYWFVIDMGRNNEVGGFSIQHRNDMSSVNNTSIINNVPTKYYVQFAKDSVGNVSDTASWNYRTPEYFVEMDYSTFFLRRSFRFPQKITARYFKFVVVRNWSGNSNAVDAQTFTRLGEIWMDY